MTKLTPNTQITPETVGWVSRHVAQCLADGLEGAFAIYAHAQDEDDLAVCHIDSPAASSPSAVGVDAGTQTRRFDGWHWVDVKPEPAPVDWSVVGPKLVEALERARAVLDNTAVSNALRMVGAHEIIDAALAAATPGGK